MDEKKCHAQRQQAENHSSKTGQDESPSSGLLHEVESDKREGKVTKGYDSAKTYGSVVVDSSGHLHDCRGVIPAERERGGGEGGRREQRDQLLMGCFTASHSYQHGRVDS